MHQTMSFKINTVLLLISLLISTRGISSEKNEHLEFARETLQLPRSAIEELTNLTRGQDLWILMPSNVSSDDRISDSELSLFKLNMDQLSDIQEDTDEARVWNGSLSGAGPVEGSSQLSGVFREARKMSLFGSVLNKPKVSPLYLVNGTVCRFVNTQPICTTLSTTGLFRGSTITQSNTINPFQQQQQQGNINPQQRQVGPNSMGFNSQPNNLQPFRPAAVLEDENQELNVGATSNSSSGRSVQTTRPNTQATQSAGPLNFVTNRRPLNLLSLRPFRTQYRRRGKEISLELA